MKGHITWKIDTLQYTNIKVNSIHTFIALNWSKNHWNGALNQEQLVESLSLGISLAGITSICHQLRVCISAIRAFLHYRLVNLLSVQNRHLCITSISFRTPKFESVCVSVRPYGIRFCWLGQLYTISQW